MWCHRGQSSEEGHPLSTPACCSWSFYGQHPSWAVQELRLGWLGCRWRCSAGNVQLDPWGGGWIWNPSAQTWARNLQFGSFLSGERCGRGRRASQRGQWCGTVKIKRTKEKAVMKKELMKGKEVVSTEAGVYELSPESGVFSHSGGLGACKEGGMLARWDVRAGTTPRNQTVLGMLRRMPASPPAVLPWSSPFPVFNARLWGLGVLDVIPCFCKGSLGA